MTLSGSSNDPKEVAVSDESGDTIDYEEWECPGYPEHDYEAFGEGDDVIYRCRRCDAETWDEDPA